MFLTQQNISLLTLLGSAPFLKGVHFELTPVNYMEAVLAKAVRNALFAAVPLVYDSRLASFAFYLL